MAEKRLAVENLYMFKIDFILYVITINTIVVNHIYLHYNLITEPIYEAILRFIFSLTSEFLQNTAVTR